MSNIEMEYMELVFKNPSKKPITKLRNILKEKYKITNTKELNLKIAIVLFIKAIKENLFMRTLFWDFIKDCLVYEYVSYEIFLDKYIFLHGHMGDMVKIDIEKETII